MRTYPIPFNEADRLAALRACMARKEKEGAVFDAMAEAARSLLRGGAGLVSLVEEDEQVFTGMVGLDQRATPRNWSFCAHTITTDAPMVVLDTHEDPRFADQYLVRNAPHIRFYAGAPIILASGHRIGSLCVLDWEPREMPAPHEIETLVNLARSAAALFDSPAAAETPQHEADSDLQAEFMALIAHELRTPVAVMYGNARLLETRLPDGLEHRMTRAIRRSCENLTGLINSVINYADASTGELAINTRKMDLPLLLEDIIEAELPVFHANDKDVCLIQSDLEAWVDLDPDHIRIALTNVIENARLHGGSCLTVTVNRDELGHVELRFSDNGQLKDKAAIEKLYQPFRVGENVDTRSVGGLGLGLPLTRKIIELHGGDMGVEAGEFGTSVVLRLPGWRVTEEEPALKLSSG
ncbi:GAF domain-containing sensor histidine kinase [Mesobaculum littorinae]|nr:GAF domain-containing sensor histidine kinase [Mesobaculum littorinae]